MAEVKKTAEEALDMQTANADDDLINSLIEEYGEDSPEYTQDDMKGVDFVRSAGIYRGFIKSIDITKKKREQATKTMAAGTVYRSMSIVLAVKEDEHGNAYGGELRDWIIYEQGNMRNYDFFCVSAQTKRIESKEGVFRRFPQASHEHGGAVGMPISFEVEMGKPQISMKWEQVGEKRVKVENIDEDTGQPKMIQFPEVVRYFPWDTDSRYSPEQQEVPEIADEIADEF